MTSRCPYNSVVTLVTVDRLGDRYPEACETSALDSDAISIFRCNSVHSIGKEATAIYLVALKRRISLHRGSVTGKVDCMDAPMYRSLTALTTHCVEVSLYGCSVARSYFM